MIVDVGIHGNENIEKLYAAHYISPLGIQKSPHSNFGVWGFLLFKNQETKGAGEMRLQKCKRNR